MVNDLLANESMSNSLVEIEIVLDQDHVDMAEIDLIGKAQKEIEVRLPDVVVAADVIVHIVPNGLSGLIIYHLVAAGLN